MQIPQLTNLQKLVFYQYNHEYVIFLEGDIVYIPAKKLHTHGSIDKKQVFSHIAINANPSINKPAKTTWYESDFKTKVTKIL